MTNERMANSKWHDLEPVSLEFFDIARYKIKHSITINCTTDRMMEALRDNTQWAKWALPIKFADWTSTQRGLNATRSVFLIGGIVLEEIFFHWSEGSRVSFFVQKANVPGLRKFAEDHHFHYTDDQLLKLDCTVAFEMTRAARFVSPLIHISLRLALPIMLNRYKLLLEEKTAYKTQDQ